MVRAGRLLDYIGGSVGRVAGAGVIAGLFFIAFGMSPAEAVIWVFQHPPAFISAVWFRIGILILGLALIGVSLRYNIWSKKQKAIDALAEDLSWAIHDLVNRDPKPYTNEEVARWEEDYHAWCQRVSEKLENRAFFTRADQLHFDRLGFIDPISMSGEATLDWLLAQLKLKFERLRDVINWSQMRGH
jgi:hypothetical protein